MGTRVTFKCDCGYSANVSGGADVGCHFETNTVVCGVCKEIRDIIVKADDEWKKEIGKCGGCGGTDVRNWGVDDNAVYNSETDSYESEKNCYDCPKCGGKMSVDPDGDFILTD